MKTRLALLFGGLALLALIFALFFWAPAPPAAPGNSGAVVPRQNTFVLKAAEPVKEPEGLFAPVGEVLAAAVPAIMNQLSPATINEQGEVLGAAVQVVKKYVTRGRGSGGSPLPPAPVLTADGCSADPCTFATTSVALTWSKTNGASVYRVLVNDAEALSTGDLGASVVLGDLATSAVAVVAVHGASQNGAGFISNTLTIYIETPDTVAPVFDADSFSNVEVVAASTTATSALATFGLPVATDDRDGAVTVACNHDSGEAFAVGTTTVTCDAQDSAGNEAEIQFDVVVTLPPDLVAPVLTVPADIATTTASTTATTTVVVYEATAEDETDGVLVPLCSPASGSTFATGTTEVTCTAKDAANNWATSTFAVTVTVPPDTIAPVLQNVPADFSVEATSTDSVYAIVSYTPPTATDETDEDPTVSCDPESDAEGEFVVGTTTIVTCIATDDAGNEATATFAVEVTVPAPTAGIEFVFEDASQQDDSQYCDGGGNGFESCYENGDPQYFELGSSGADLQGGGLVSITIALGELFVADIPLNTWSLTINCFTDPAYTTACTDWAGGPLANAITASADSVDATDRYWTADFSGASNFGGSQPIVFNPAYYYQLQIDTNGVGWPSYGSATQPYWVVRGVTI